MVQVFIGKALICFVGTCHPALVGHTTPHGEFQLRPLAISAPQYGGDVLEFARDNKGGVFAIHRPPTQHRQQLLRKFHRPPVTNGCVNVTNETYAALKVCCSNARIRVTP